ncbi:hypothetical protein OG474_29295 [Kribbella sp. NBC_01505]|uniref:hypothetical protein n=1 Tax=Kribbella sp. NBC_01505 TaxID=2903580 RepID=UPI0038668F2B
MHEDYPQAGQCLFQVVCAVRSVDVDQRWIGLVFRFRGLAHVVVVLDVDQLSLVYAPVAGDEVVTSTPIATALLERQPRPRMSLSATPVNGSVLAKVSEARSWLSTGRVVPDRVWLGADVQLALLYCRHYRDSMGPMVRLTLDTSCVIAAAQDEHRRQCIDRLLQLAQDGIVELWLTTAFSYDQTTAPAEARAANLAWLEDRPTIGEVPGPFRLNLSPLGGRDVLVVRAMGDIDEKIKRILLAKGLATGHKDPGRRIHDVHHLSAHWMAGHDAFVTDDQCVLKNREALRLQVGIQVVDPEEAVRVVAIRSGSPSFIRDRQGDS